MGFEISKDTLLKVSGVAAAAASGFSLVAPRDFHKATMSSVRVARCSEISAAKATTITDLPPQLGRQAGGGCLMPPQRAPPASRHVGVIWLNSISQLVGQADARGQCVPLGSGQKDAERSAVTQLIPDALLWPHPPPPCRAQQCQWRHCDTTASLA
jgi:hypothetical protein